MNITQNKKQRFALLFLGTAIVALFYYIINRLYSYFGNNSRIITGYSVSEIDVLKNTINLQDAEINRLKQVNSSEIFQVVKVVQDGQTVFNSTIMPVNYNKNRLQIILNNDIVLSNNDGYTFNPTNQQLTLTLPGIALEVDNEVKFCFY